MTPRLPTKVSPNCATQCHSRVADYYRAKSMHTQGQLRCSPSNTGEQIGQLARRDACTQSSRSPAGSASRAGMAIRFGTVQPRQERHHHATRRRPSSSAARLSCFAAAAPPTTRRAWGDTRMRDDGRRRCGTCVPLGCSPRRGTCPSGRDLAWLNAANYRQGRAPRSLGRACGQSRQIVDGSAGG